MARRSVIFHKAARRDLERLLAYIIENQALPRTAHDYVDRITARCELLGDTPFIGTNRSAFGPGVRTLPFEGVVIAFHVGSSSVRIRRIFGQAQNYQRLLHRP